MNLFRRKFLVALLFGLISFGQAHPFAVAWAHPAAHECSCNHSGRKCIHGCDLKKQPRWAKLLRWKPASKAPPAPVVMPCHEGKQDGNHSDEGQVEGDDTTGHWVSPSCSKQQLQRWLSFHGDPFLLAGPQNFLAPGFDLGREFNHMILHGRKLACEDPPPKE